MNKVKGLIFKITDHKGFPKHNGYLGLQIKMNDEPVIGKIFKLETFKDSYLKTLPVISSSKEGIVWTVKTEECIYIIHDIT